MQKVKRKSNFVPFVPVFYLPTLRYIEYTHLLSLRLDFTNLAWDSLSRNPKPIVCLNLVVSDIVLTFAARKASAAARGERERGQ